MKNTIVLLIVAVAFILPGCAVKRKRKRCVVQVKKPGYVNREESYNVPAEARKPLKSLTINELEKVHAYYARVDNVERALKVIERMIPLTSDPIQLKKLRLELAHAYFKSNNFEKASSLYTHYAMLYPGSYESSQATYKALKCLYKTMLNDERDQTKTRAAIQLAQSFLKKYDQHAQGYEKYAPQVRKILAESVQKLVDYEFNVINFHAKQGNYNAAYARLNAIKKELITLTEKIETITEPRLLALETVLCEQLGKTDNAHAKEKEIQVRFPQFYLEKQATKVAINNSKKHPRDIL